MERDFWFDKWKKNEIGFHQDHVHPMLKKFLGKLCLSKQDRIFLPLCGKTNDIGWLLEQGFRVVGIELVESAVKQLFENLGISPSISTLDEFKHFHHENIDIYVGDFFFLSKKILGHVDAIYDRAAIVALPDGMREQYTQHLSRITESANQLLITFDYNQALMNGPPFSVSENQIKAYYDASYSITQLMSEDVPGGLKQTCDAKENLWLLRNANKIHEQNICVYDKHASAWDKHRPYVFFEKSWLDKFIENLPSGSQILDAGCGAGKPIAEYLIGKGFNLTGIDASQSMLDIVRDRYPNHTWLKMDMRNLNLDAKYDGIISWDAFFHLTQHEQRQVIRLFANHLNPKATLLLTIGHEAGEVTGTVEGDEVYHASLDPQEYKSILVDLGFTDISIHLEDETCGHHSIILATRG